MANIREFIAFRALDNAIKDENVSKGLRLKDKNVLVERFLCMQDFVDLQSHGLARPLGRDFPEPAVLIKGQSIELC